MITKRILIVDDEKPIREAVRLCLEIMGSYEVLAASSGEEGLQIAETEQPDVILLDMLMTGLDGLTTLQKLLQNPATKTIPVILLTAQTGTNALASQMQEGLAGIITKPFVPTQLAAQIAEILGW